MIDSHGSTSPLDDVVPVSSALEIAQLVEAVREVHVSDAVRPYVVKLVGATRSHPDLPSEPAREQLSTCCAHRRPQPRSTSATTCCPTTCSGSPYRCCRTGCW